MTKRWKAQVTNPSSAPPRLRSIVVKKSGERFVARFNLEDGTFFDTETSWPRFDLNEEITISLNKDLDIGATE